MSFYVEAVNRDAFMAVKQDLLLAFIDCVDRNGAKLAKQRLEARALYPHAYRRPWWQHVCGLMGHRRTPCCQTGGVPGCWYIMHAYSTPCVPHVQVEVAAAQQLPAQQMRAAQASAPDGAPAASASGAGASQQQPQRALPDGKPLPAGSQQAPVDVSPTPPGSTFSQPG